MTGDRTADLLFYGLMLLLPLSALFSQRVPVTTLLRSILSWAVIFAIGLVLVSQRDRITDWWAVNGDRFVASNQTVVGREVRIRMASDGHFWADVAMNGVSRRMLVDSGATITALSVPAASAAGLIVQDDAFPVILNTANGRVNANRGTVGTLRLGTITATNLDVVVSPAFGDTDVIGMNFLSRLASWRVEGQTLILTPKQA